jgi:hypothetical protein
MPWCRAVRPVQPAAHKQPAGRTIDSDCGVFRLDHRAKARRGRELSRLDARSLRWCRCDRGAFLMQFMMQGAWGVIPVHLNELSPDDARGAFPRFTYQLGSPIASVNAPL